MRTGQGSRWGFALSEVVRKPHAAAALKGSSCQIHAGNSADSPEGNPLQRSHLFIISIVSL